MKKQILVVMASFMMMSSAFPTYAATVVAGGATTSQDASTTQNESSDGINWIIPRDGYSRGAHDGYDWWQAEAAAQAQKWAEDNKGDIPSIADEKARYEAVANKVCDFLTYDTTLDYGHVHIAYSIRDGKGVCSDYTILGKALCDAVGINARISVGANTSAGLDHNMLKPVINGKEYYSDLSAHDTNGTSILAEVTPGWYNETYVGDSLMNIIPHSGDAWESDSIDVAQVDASKRGEVVLCSSAGNIYYGSREDAEALNRAIENDDDATVFAIFDKYGIPYVK